MGYVLDNDLIHTLNRIRPAGRATTDGLGTQLDNALQGILPADSIGDSEINWGTGAGEVSAADMPIADAGTHFTTDDVESALAQLGELKDLLDDVADGASGADAIGLTPNALTGAAATVQAAIDALTDQLASEADGYSGGNYVHLTPIAETGGAATIQEVIEALVARIKAVADGSSGADLVGATAISGWVGGTVQAILESAKADADGHRELVVPLSYRQAGYVDADVAGMPLGLGFGDGYITKAAFTLGNTGADATDPLSVIGNVYVGGASVFSVRPEMTKAAADAAWTLANGTGITAGVLRDDVPVSENAVISCSWQVTRTTPEEEMADLFLYVEVGYPRT